MTMDILSEIGSPDRRALNFSQAYEIEELREGALEIAGWQGESRSSALYSYQRIMAKKYLDNLHMDRPDLRDRTEILGIVSSLLAAGPAGRRPVTE